MSASISERVLTNTGLDRCIDDFKSDVETRFGTNLQRKIDQADNTVDDIFLYGKVRKNDNQVKATAYKRLVRSYADLTIGKSAKQSIDLGLYGVFKKFVLNLFRFKTAVEHAEDKLKELEKGAYLLEPETGKFENAVTAEVARLQAEKTKEDVIYHLLTNGANQSFTVKPDGTVAAKRFTMGPKFNKVVAFWFGAQFKVV